MKQMCRRVTHGGSDVQLDTLTLAIACRSEVFPHRAAPPQRRTKCPLSLCILSFFLFFSYFSFLFFSFFIFVVFFIFSFSSFFQFFLFVHFLFDPQNGTDTEQRHGKDWRMDTTRTHHNGEHAQSEKSAPKKTCVAPTKKTKHQCYQHGHSARERGVSTQKHVNRLVTGCPNRGCGFRCPQVQLVSDDDLMR